MFSRLVLLVVWLFVVGQVFGVGLYYYQVLQAIGVVLATLLCFVTIALPFVTFIWIKEHKNAHLRRLGELLEVVAAHSALLYGTILTVLVFLAIGLLNGDPMPDNASEFLIGFVGVCSVTSAMIYGAMAICVVAFSERLAARLLGSVLALVVIGVPIGWYATADMMAVARVAPQAFFLFWCTYLAIGSVVCWRVFLTSVKDTRKKASARNQG